MIAPDVGKASATVRISCQQAIVPRRVADSCVRIELDPRLGLARQCSVAAVAGFIWAGLPGRVG